MCDSGQVVDLLTQIRDLLAQQQSSSAPSPADDGQRERSPEFPELPDPVVVTGD